LGEELKFHLRATAEWKEHSLAISPAKPAENRQGDRCLSKTGRGRVAGGEQLSDAEDPLCDMGRNQTDGNLSATAETLILNSR
jgi:hypothetical protein